MRRELGTVALNPQTLEDEKVAGAIKTDFILSAEIMAITLAAVPQATIWTQALVLAVVGIGITVAVYGVVALIVKADDVGVALASNETASAMGAVSRALGRALVFGMPGFLTFLSVARHRRHDLGRRRHHRAWPGALRPDRDRPRHPRRRRSRSACAAGGRRAARMDRDGGLVRASSDW